MPFNSAYNPVEVGKAPMPEFRFDPPLTLKGNVVVRNLDDAVRFMVGYRGRTDLSFRPVYYTGLKEPLAKPRSAVLETHFWTG
jgi:hypothetical protein